MLIAATAPLVGACVTVLKVVFAESGKFCYRFARIDGLFNNDAAPF
jgi:hypothetical protein